ncbi:MAG TPA: hypothetical protein VFQ35_15190 [Polyangiaceae bacterium]|nr:hypothetical protein [Polyangiaceae bacterium]
MLLSAHRGEAATPDAADGPSLAPARELWLEGQQAYQSGDYVRAADRFDRAYELERVPPLGLWVARSLMQAGRWVDALDRYREVADQSLPSDASSRDWAARRVAKLERQQLLPRVPNVIVLLAGAPSSEVTVEVNGTFLPSEFLGIARAVDPGPVRVHGEHGKQTADANIDIAEGETRTVQLSFAEPPPKREPARSVAPPLRPSSRGEVQRVVSFVAVGVGGAALLTGGVFATLAAGDEGRLLRDCPMSRCPASYRSNVETYESKKTVATVALWSGAALATAGLVLYFTLPKSTPSSRALGAFWAGSHAGVWGRF